MTLSAAQLEQLARSPEGRRARAVLRQAGDRVDPSMIPRILSSPSENDQVIDDLRSWSRRKRLEGEHEQADTALRFARVLQEEEAAAWQRAQGGSVPTLERVDDLITRAMTFLAKSGRAP